MLNRHGLTAVLIIGFVFLSGSLPAQQNPDDPFHPDNVKFDPDGLPEVEEGFEVNILAREPAFIHISALAVGKQGRLYAGGGPQYRQPDPDTPKDSVWVVVDKNQDGKADGVKEFATGFNSVQGLAWRDGALWVANAPDLTYVRDTDGDLKADRYVKVLTHLGHLRHGLHGLVWAPDGRLYMSQGNSRVQKGAPEPFRELHNVESDDPVEQPINKVYTPEQYEADYIGEWPSEEGGYLRMDPDGQNLEIFARGLRNPWDWTFGPGFNWLGNDQDPGNYGDRMLMPFEGAYFGMKHPDVDFDWMGEDPRVAPASHHFTRYDESSLVGMVYYKHRHFPENFRNIFFVNDWANNNIYTFRPYWDGANLKDDGGMESNFADGGETKGAETEYVPEEGKPLFRPTDLVVGPSGALYVGGWGAKYGSSFAPHRPEDKKGKLHYGRIFRIRHSERPLTPRKQWLKDRRTQPYNQWSFDQLIADLDNQVRTWRTDAQLELVRRGTASRRPLLNALESGTLSMMAETYAVWTLGRIGPDLDRFSSWARGDGGIGTNRRIQAIRVLGEKKTQQGAEVVARQLADSSPRVRKAAALNIDDIGESKHITPLASAMRNETDSTVFYTQWKALRALASRDELIAVIKQADSVNVQGGALFALDNIPEAVCEHLTLSGKDGFEKVKEILEEKMEESCGM